SDVIAVWCDHRSHSHLANAVVRFKELVLKRVRRGGVSDDELIDARDAAASAVNRVKNLADAASTQPPVAGSMAPDALEVDGSAPVPQPAPVSRDLKKQQGEKMPETQALRDTLFISYSHKDDAKFLEQLLVHLKPLERAGLVTTWSDKQIAPGSQWFQEI